MKNSDNRCQMKRTEIIKIYSIYANFASIEAMTTKLNETETELSTKLNENELSTKINADRIISEENLNDKTCILF